MHFNNWAEYWASGMGWYLTASLMRSSQRRMIHRTVIVTAHDQDEGERQQTGHLRTLGAESKRPKCARRKQSCFKVLRFRPR